MLKESYDGLTEQDIRALPHEELVLAVIRMLSVVAIDAQGYFGSVYNPDELADAFRNRGQ